MSNVKDLNTSNLTVFLGEGPGDYPSVDFGSATVIQQGSRPRGTSPAPTMGESPFSQNGLATVGLPSPHPCWLVEEVIDSQIFDY